MDSSFSHVALLVSSVESSAEFLRTRNIQSGEPGIFESEGTKEIYVGAYEEQSGLLLLLESISEGPYKRAFEKRGPSLHHIAIDVLDIEGFVQYAIALGWMLHPKSSVTMAHNAAWLYLKGIPTLIEVHQKQNLSNKTSKVSRIKLPIEKEQLALFEGLGLGGIVYQGKNLCLIVDEKELDFSQLACLK